MIALFAPRAPSIRGQYRFKRRAFGKKAWRYAAIAALIAVTGCATFNGPANSPLANGGASLPAGEPPEVPGDTALALAFSGGGTRAAAFSYGVLLGLDHLPAKAGQSDLDRVVFVSGVSGGSVTAAYFGLKGRQGFRDFRERFLVQNAEEYLATSVSLVNLVKGLSGGVNDESRLSSWLDDHLFHGATLGAMFRPDRPLIWINASDLYHRTPFVFSSTTFAALCSDITRYPLSQAVAASAAVPIAFVPIVLESFPQDCATPAPPWIERVSVDPNASAQAKAYAQALIQYRSGATRYLKLADGGLTDNFGLSGLVIARAAADQPYAPLTAEKAVRLRRIVFIVVNSGQAATGNWSQTIEGPSGADLLNAVTDTAIDSSVRSGFDAFRLSVKQWEAATRSWRCKLPHAQALKLGAPAGWRCSNISFDIVELAFDNLDADRASKLSSIPTRFKLDTADVDLLIQSGIDVVAKNEVLNER